MFYQVIIFILFFSYLINQHGKNHVVDYIVLLIITLFAGLSYTNGWDWYGYREFYEEVRLNGFYGVESLTESGIEKGFLIYIYLISLSTLGFSFFVFINSVFINVLLFKAIRKIGLNYCLFMLFFFVTAYTRLELSTLRQGIAVTMILYAFGTIIITRDSYKSFICFLLICIFAYFFHRSALIVLLLSPMIFLLKSKKIHYLIAFFAFPFSFISGYLNSILLNGFVTVIPEWFRLIALKISVYLSMAESAYINPQAIVLLISYFVFILLRSKYGFSKKENILLNIMACEIIIVFYLSFMTQLMIIRFIYYFQIGWIGLTMMLTHRIIKQKGISIIFILVLLQVKFMLNFRSEADRAVYFPYKNVISGLVDDNYGRTYDYIIHQVEKELK